MQLPSLRHVVVKNDNFYLIYGLTQKRPTQDIVANIGVTWKNGLFENKIPPLLHIIHFCPFEMTEICGKLL
jgi:hypothetical protein